MPTVVFDDEPLGKYRVYLYGQDVTGICNLANEEEGWAEVCILTWYVDENDRNIPLWVYGNEGYANIASTRVYGHVRVLEVNGVKPGEAIAEAIRCHDGRGSIEWKPTPVDWERIAAQHSTVMTDGLPDVRWGEQAPSRMRKRQAATEVAN